MKQGLVEKRDKICQNEQGEAFNEVEKEIEKYEQNFEMVQIDGREQFSDINH